MVSGNEKKVFEQTKMNCRHCGNMVDITPGIRLGYFSRYEEVVELEAEIKRLKALLVEASLK